MSKPSHLSTSLKLFLSLHLFLTFLSIGGVLYLVYSLRETQIELKNLKDSCALCEGHNSVKTESDRSRANNESIFDKDAQSDFDSQANERRKKRELVGNQTCTKMLRDFTKLLEVTNKMVSIMMNHAWLDLDW